MHLRPKTIHALAIFTATVLLNTTAKAEEILYVPAFCSPQQLTLFISNSGKAAQKLWTQIRISDSAGNVTAIDEIQHDVDPQSEMKIRASDFLKDRSAFSVKVTSAKNLKVTAICSENDQNLVLSSFTSPRISHYFPKNISSFKLSLVNLFLKAQTIKLEAYDAAGILIEARPLQTQNYYDTESLKWSLPRPVSRVDIRGEERFHSDIFYGDDSSASEQQSPGVVIKNMILPADPQKVYFLVSTKSGKKEGFVIGLTEPDKIKTAREQIANPALEKIIVGSIQLGSGDYNRAFYSKDKSPYSWSVAHVDNFADFANIDCDGSPDQVEERLPLKIQEGRICFWRYRVVRELTYQEVVTGE